MRIKIGTSETRRCQIQNSALASGDTNHIAFKSGDLNEQSEHESTLASGDANHIAFKSGDLNERTSGYLLQTASHEVY